MNFRKILLTTTMIGVASFAQAEQYNVAFLSASAANTWLNTSYKSMQIVADENNIKLTEFDGQFDPAKQTVQIQDIIASGQYNGIIIASLNGAGAIPDVEAALEAGMEVVVINQVIGTDLKTSDPQVEGVAASVLVSPYQGGVRRAGLTIKACEGVDPCEVVYLYGIKGSPLDDALREGFDTTVADYPNIQIIAEGEGKYLGPEGGITATQDILQVNSDFDVMVGSDQALQGAEIVLKDEGLLEKVKLIGVGGSTPAIEGIKNGTWFGSVYGAPADEGRIAMEAMVDALVNDNHQGGIDPLALTPDDGMVSSDNVDKFSAQWDG